MELLRDPYNHSEIHAATQGSKIHTTTQGSELKEIHHVEVIDSCSSAGQVMSYYLQNFPSFSLGVIHATSVHISLVTTRHVAFPHYKGAEKCGLLQKHQPPVIMVIPIAMLNSSLLNARLIITS